MKTIIVPTDFSPFADNALDFALQIAPKIEATVLLLHVIDLPPLIQTLYMDNYGLEQLYTDAKKQAEEKLKQQRDKHRGKILSSVVFQGRLVTVLNDIERQYNAQLIVMGTKGASGIKETFIGSNTEKVIRNSRTPVISIHGKTLPLEIKNIVVPTNGKDIHNGFFGEVQKLQKMFNANIYVVFINALHAFENEEEVKEELHKYASKANLQNYQVDIIRAITPEDGIENYVEENKFDMVAITTHGRQGLSHMLYGSLAENLANHLRVPVFTYNLKIY